MSQALYRKWRPLRFDQVVGQEHITRTLQNSVAAGRVGHAYLFCGPRGTGKTTTARLLAKAVNCLYEDPAQRPCNQCPVCTSVNDGRFLDLIEIDAASNTGVDDIRDLREKINFAPNQGRFKVYIIDEVHMLSTAAFNALLKTLEEPPAHAIFILATTEEHKVPLTIKSRCQQFNFRLLSVGEISGRLLWLADQESLTIEPEALDLIARQGNGSVRDAESLLDQLVTAPEDTITLERAQMVLGTATNMTIISLTDAWLNADGAMGLHIIAEALSSGADARQFSRQVVNHLRTMLLLQAAGPDLALDIPVEHKEAIRIQAQRAPRAELIKAIRRFHSATMEPSASWQPQLPLELAFMELLPAKPAPALVILETPLPKEETATHQVMEKPSAEFQVPETAVDQKPAPPPEPTPQPVTTSEEMVTPAQEKPVIASQSPLLPTLEEVKAHWREMINLVSQRNKNLPPLMAMSKPLAVENNIIILGFDYPIFREKFDKTPNAAVDIGDVFSELLDSTCGVRCVVTSDYIVPISSEEFETLAQELGGLVSEED